MELYIFHPPYANIPCNYYFQSINYKIDFIVSRIKYSAINFLQPFQLIYEIMR